MTHPLPQGVIEAEMKRAVPVVRTFGPNDFVGSVMRERDWLIEKGYQVELSWTEYGVRMEVRNGR